MERTTARREPAICSGARLERSAIDPPLPVSISGGANWPRPLLNWANRLIDLFRDVAVRRFLFDIANLANNGHAW